MAEGTVHVLVVDQDPAVRESTADILRLAGYDVSEARHTAEAASVLDAGPVNLLILDVGPEGGELALLDRLPDPPPVVIVVSGAVEGRHLAHPLVRAFLPKPIPPAQLLESVARELAPGQD